jgi:hypothetical protein
VHLKEFSLVSPKIPSREIFKAIEIAIPASAIEQRLLKRRLRETSSNPACTTGSMSGNRNDLWSKDSMRDVLKNLIDGLNEAWIKIGKYGGFHVNLQSLKPDKD